MMTASQTRPHPQGISLQTFADEDDENVDDYDADDGQYDGDGGDDDDSKLDQATPVGDFPSDSCCPPDSGCIIL